MARTPRASHRLYLQVLAGLVLGIAVGYVFPAAGVSLRPLADGVVKLVRMMIAPVVFCVIVSGITGISETRVIGRTLLKAIALFYAMVALALLTGMVVALVVRPGAGLNVDPRTLDVSAVAQYTRVNPAEGFVAFLMRIIPQSYVGAFAEGDVLPIVFLAVLTGWAMTRVGRAAAPVRDLVESFQQILFAAFGFIIRLSPLGAFGAMAFTVGQYGVQSLRPLALLVFGFYAACAIFVIAVVVPLARACGVSVWRLLRYFRDELLIILGTSTSDPVLPRLLQKLEQLGCEKRIVGLVLPLSYSFNLTGIAVFLTVATLFLAQACNIHLTAGRLASMLLVMLLTSKGATGVAGSGFVVLVATLSVFPDIPVAAVSLIVGVDRFMSEIRAVTSTIGNIVATIVVSIWEGACDRATLGRALSHGTESRSEGL